MNLIVKNKLHLKSALWNDFKVIKQISTWHIVIKLLIMMIYHFNLKQWKADNYFIAVIGITAERLHQYELTYLEE